MTSLDYRGWRSRCGSVLLGATVLVVPTLASACSPPGPADAVTANGPQEQQETFDRSADVVFETITALLVERDEMTAAVASDWMAQSRSALDNREPVRVTSESVDVSADQLRDLVRADQTGFVSDAGGRYYLTISITPESRARTTVAVVATFVGATPGPGPIGGRPLASNGSIERAVLDALRQSMN